MEYREYLDIESCVDWWFVNELMQNEEPFHPKSVYFHKDINGKMKMGPVWDFDWGTLCKTNISGFTNTKHLYFDQLFKDSEFKTLVKERWNTYYEEFKKISDYIDATAEKLNKSQELNYAKWGYQSYPNYESTNYNAAVEKIKTSYNNKLEWLNSEIEKL